MDKKYVIKISSDLDVYYGGSIYVDPYSEKYEATTADFNNAYRYVDKQSAYNEAYRIRTRCDRPARVIEESKAVGFKVNRRIKRYTKSIKSKQSYCAYDLKALSLCEIYDCDFSDLEIYADPEVSLAIDKLGEIEDVERSLKVDFMTLMSSCENGFYSEYFKCVVKPIRLVIFEKDTRPHFEVYDKAHDKIKLIFVDDYMKTWRKK